MADEPGKIEVQLSLLSGQESAAFREIQQTAKQVTEMMQMFKSRDFVETAERLAKVHEQMVKSSKQMGDVSREMQEQERQSGVRGRIGGALQNIGQKMGGGGSIPKADEKKAHEELADRAKQDAKEREEARRQRKLESMTDAERAAQHRRERFAGKLGFLGEDTIAGTEAAERIPALNPDAAGIKIPRFGELTVQDLLGWAGRSRLDKAEAAARAGDTGTMTRMLGSSAKVADWSRAAGNVAAGYTLYRTARRALSAPGGMYGGFMSNFDETTPMGYRRDSNAFSDILGVQTPLSAYGGQSGREMVDQWRMRWSAGINKEQAAAINDAANRAGFAGPLGSSIRTELMAPAFRQFKVDPNNLIPFTQTIRTGTATIQDLNQVIMEMGEGARSARMDMNSFAQAIAQAGENAQASGGTFLQGASFGQQFSASTGLTPSTGINLLNNGVVQSYMAARTGLPPNLSGAASPLAQQRAIEQALMERVSAYTGTMPSHREPIRDAAGNIIGYESTSGRDAAIGAAAQDLGINQEEAKAILNRRGSQGVSNFMAASRQYLQQVTGGKSPEDDRRRRDAIIKRMEDRGDLKVYSHGSQRDEIDLKYDEQTGRVLRKGAGTLGFGWGEDKDRTRQLREQMYGSRMKKFDKNTAGVDLRELHEMAMAAGVSQSDWSSQVDHQGDARKRVEAAQKLVQQRSIDVNQDPNAIKFTGPAAKFFEALVKSNKGLAGAADLSKTAIATSNSGPSPLTPTTSAGGPLYP